MWGKNVEVNFVAKGHRNTPDGGGGVLQMHLFFKLWVGWGRLGGRCGMG